MSLRCIIVPVTPYQQNCTVLKCEETGRGAIVDPGGDIELIERGVAQLDTEIEKILITHGHMDHCAATLELSGRLGVPVEGPHREDDFWIQMLPQSCEMSGMPVAQPFVPDRWLEQGEIGRAHV